MNLDWILKQKVFGGSKLHSLTHVNSRSNTNLETSVILHNHEKEKKRVYMERVIEIEHGSSSCF